MTNICLRQTMNSQYHIVEHSHKNIFVPIKYFLYCDHEDREVTNPDIFEVVPDWQEGHDLVTIESQDEFSLTVTDTSTNSTFKFPDNGKSKLRKYSIECEPLKIKEGSIFEKCWKKLTQPREYDIKIQDQKGEKDFKIKVYCPDEYSFSLHFPALRKFSRGSKMGIKLSETGRYLQNRSVQKNVIKKYNDQKWNPFTETSSKISRTKKEQSYNNRTTIHFKRGDEKQIKKAGPIFVTRNGLIVQVDFLEIIGSMLSLADLVYDMYNAVTEDIPQVGWYCDLDFQLMRGAFELVWGWREAEDHRAYLYIGVGIDIKIFEISAEIGIGISGFGIKLQVFGRIEGSLAIKILAAHNSPDLDSSISVPLESEIDGILGARFEVKYFVQVEGLITTAIKIEDAEAPVSVENGWFFKGEFWWTGIKAKIKTSCGMEAGVETEFGSLKINSEKSMTIVEKTKLGNWLWPQEKVERQKELSPREIRKILKNNFTKGFNIRVEDRKLFWDKSWSLDQIVDNIEVKINKRRDIQRDEKTIDLLAWHIRQELEKISDRGDWHDVYRKIDSNRFIWFLERGEFDKILENYIHPTKEALMKCT